jgi:hypothetical protein
MLEKHPVEALDSWKTHLQRSGKVTGDEHRFLKHHHHNDKQDLLMLEQQKETEYFDKQNMKLSRAEAKRLRKESKHRAEMKDLYKHPGIAEDTVHGLMVR